MSKQSMEALALANEVRLGAAGWRRDVDRLEREDGKLMLARMLEQDPIPRHVAVLRLDRFLTAIHRVGPAHAGQVLARARITRRNGKGHPHLLRVGDLTEGERCRLASELRS